jgi:hypothetical protein
MRSKKTSEPIEIGLPTTPADVLAQRRLREETRPFPLDRIDDLSPPRFFSLPLDRRTSRGWEAFRLPDRRETDERE